MTLFLQIGKEQPSLCLGGESTAECTAGPAGGDGLAAFRITPLPQMVSP